MSATIETLDPKEVSRLLDARILLLIDVREPEEFATQRIRGAFLYPLSDFKVDAIPDAAARRVVFQCGSGKRSLAAAEKYVAAGRGNVAHMGGGIAAWIAAGLPVVGLGR